MSIPYFSIIVPTLNEADFLPICLSSLKNQSESDFEVIVSDGGSTDRTREIVAQFGYHWVQTQRGRAHQMNFAVQEKAQGEILLFLHSDVQLAKEALASMRQQLEHSPKIVGGAFWIQIDANDWIYRLISWASNWRCRLTKYPYGDQGIFVRRAYFQKIGGFPEVKIFEEVLLMRQLKPFGSLFFIRNNPIRISARRWKEEGIFYTIIRNFLLTVAFYAGIAPEKLARFYPPRKALSKKVRSSS